jgi:transposase-like protein
MGDFGLHLPEDKWKCKDCGAEFNAEFGIEKPTCVICGSENITARVNC